jgi:16S rRNA (cytidine1402-2'-O)-methyltransferase
MTAGKQLAAGLYLVSTPIGAARDITLRAMDILAAADVIAAEDTRNTRKLMEIHSIALSGRPLVAYHDHNGAAQRPRILQHLEDGLTVAYVSDAGTPLVADPGFGLGRAVIEAGFPIFAAPGASAVLSALVVSGLPSDRFLFAGFAPTAAGARKTFLQELAPTPATLILYESPKRLSRLLSACVYMLGPDRQAAVCRELTKKFEEVQRGTLAELADHYADLTPKGEIVVVIDRGTKKVSEADMETALDEALRTMRVKDAASFVAEALGLPRRQVYQAALARDKS